MGRAWKFCFLTLQMQTNTVEISSRGWMRNKAKQSSHLAPIVFIIVCLFVCFGWLWHSCPLYEERFSLFPLADAGCVWKILAIFGNRISPVRSLWLRVPIGRLASSVWIAFWRLCDPSQGEEVQKLFQTWFLQRARACVCSRSFVFHLGWYHRSFRDKSSYLASSHWRGARPGKPAKKNSSSELWHSHSTFWRKSWACPASLITEPKVSIFFQVQKKNF